MKTLITQACGRAMIGSARMASAIRCSVMSLGGAILLAGASSLPAATVSFPGAVGFGDLATGARGGSTYYVTNLSDNGTGSFRTAVSSGNRTVVFSVGGYIVLDSAVSVSSNITIAGQTAPGGGIGIMGAEVSFYGQSNIICRYVRFRQGTLGSTTESAVNLGSSGGSGDPTCVNVILDHCSFEFGQWDTVDGVGCEAITVQNCVIADPINQQFGGHIEGGNFTWYQNLWVNAHNRQPLAKNNTQYIQNVIYNYGAAYTVANTGGIFSHDIVNNYFITGPATTSASNDFYQMDSGQSVYSAGNLLDSNNDGTLNGSSTSPSGVTVLSSPWASTTSSLTTLSAANAYANDIVYSGALPTDQVDALVISQVTKLGSGTSGYTAGTDGPGGGLYTSQSQTGLGNSGYGNISSDTAPTDTDSDGLPDYWEDAVSGNATGENATTINSNGYSNLEVYLNAAASSFTSPGIQPNGVYELIPRNATSLAMTVAGGNTSNNSNVDVETYTGGTNQEWRIQVMPNGYYRLVPINSASNNQVLDIYGKHTANGTNVETYTYNWGTGQNYLMTNLGTGYFSITPECAQSVNAVVEVAGGGTSSGTNVDISTSTGATSQQWQLVRLY
jgi:hypothetical protein